LFFAKICLTKTGRCAGALSWRRNLLLVLHFWGAFPYDRIPKVAKGVDVHISIHSSNSCKLYQRILRFFEVTTYINIANDC
jgi:hypothetical protein